MTKAFYLDVLGTNGTNHHSKFCSRARGSIPSPSAGDAGAILERQNQY